MRPTTSLFILVIEPSLALRKIIETTLNRNGFVQVQTYSHPREALQALIQKAIPIPDIAVVCGRMVRPGDKFSLSPDGYEITRILRANKCPTKVILLLSDDSVLERVKARLAGASAFIAKPLKVQDLLEAIAAVR